MDTRKPLLLLGLFAATVAMADTWTWTDDEGVVHYSDRPHPGAERVVLQEPNSSRSPAPRAADSDADAAAGLDVQAAPIYDSFEVNAPVAEETLWNIGGVLNVSLALNPALQPGHRVRVYIDGRPVVVNDTSFQLQDVWRGVHNLQAEVLDETGNMIIRTQPRRFYVQQSSVR